MPINVFRRFDHFACELDSSDPARWTLAQLDQARARLLAEIDSKYFHLKVAEEQILDGKALPFGPATLHHWIQTNVRDCSGRYKHALSRSAAGCYLRLARELLGQGQAAKAVQALERVLSLNPMDKMAWETAGLMRDGNDAGKWLDLSRRYHIKHLRSFGQSRFKLPTSLVAVPGQQLVLVSDHVLARVFLFSYGGRLMRVLDLGLKTPGSISHNGDGTYWCCDLGNKRLVRFDLDGVLLEEIGVSSGDSHLGEVFPMHVRRPDGQRFALIACTKGYEKILAGELSGGIFRPFSGYSGTPVTMNVVENGLVVRDIYSGALHAVSGDGATASELGFAMPRLPMNYCFAHSGREWFMDFDNGRILSKFSTRGEMDYMLRLDEQFGPKTNLFHLETVRRGSQELLFAVDGGNRRIHVFETAE